jgi:hypothetical protein
VGLIKALNKKGKKREIEMKKIMMLCCLLLVSGCAPKLVTYPPTAISPLILKELDEFKLSSSVPSQEYGLAVRNVVERSKAATFFYQEKLFPVCSQMHQKYQKKDYAGTNILIAKARMYNAEWFQSYLVLKQTYEKLGEVNNKMPDGAIKTKTDELVASGKEFTERILITTNTIREFMDITEGYDRARVEMNLSFLTKKNEQKFNNLSQTLNQSGQELNKEGEEFTKLSVELSELLDKGGN